jgi:hypothetical protein
MQNLNIPRVASVARPQESLLKNTHSNHLPKTPRIYSLDSNQSFVQTSLRETRLRHRQSDFL